MTAMGKPCPWLDPDRVSSSARTESREKKKERKKNKRRDKGLGLKICRSAKAIKSLSINLHEVKKKKMTDFPLNVTSTKAMIPRAGNGAFHFSKIRVNRLLLRKPFQKLRMPLQPPPPIKLRWVHCNLNSFCWNPLSPSQSANASRRSSLPAAGEEFIPTLCPAVRQLSRTTPLTLRAVSGTTG